jgi:predicted TIM-barrel fold metal-dependent hydrolase
MLEESLAPLDRSLELIRDAGITSAVVHAPLIGDVSYSNDATAALVEAAPDLLVGFCRVDPTTGDAAAKEIVRCVASLGLHGVTISPFWHGLPCSAEVVRPIFEAADELGVPVWTHLSQQWVRNRPLDLEHPRHVDEVAGRFPRVPILCGHGGWPWVNEVVAVAWRHPNVFIDVSAFRPKHVFTAGSGWEPLVYYGSRTVADKVVFGSTWSLLGLRPSVLVDEAWASPWPEAVKRRWLHDNAAQLLSRD